LVCPPSSKKYGKLLPISEKLEILVKGKRSRSNAKQPGEQRQVQATKVPTRILEDAEETETTPQQTSREKSAQEAFGSILLFVPGFVSQRDTR
jgi:hypothetical protein